MFKTVIYPGTHRKIRQSGDAREGCPWSSLLTGLLWVEQSEKNRLYKCRRAPAGPRAAFAGLFPRPAELQGPDTSRAGVRRFVTQDLVAGQFQERGVAPRARPGGDKGVEAAL